MEQRPLRLGDHLDDYCPRERRITNHAIVALVEESVKQTRCTTCDHEHVFKGGKEPRRRKKDETSALYSQVLSGLQKVQGGADDPTPAESAEPIAAAVAVAPPVVAAPVPAPAPVAAADDAGSDEAEAEAEDEDNAGNVAQDNEPWSMHRRLIRAQLPRTGNEPPPARPIPEFTVRQPGSRGGQGRQWGRSAGGGSGQGHGGNGNGNAPGRGGQGGGPSRPAGRGGGRFAPQQRAEGRGGQG
nr:hypothetical protein [Acidobacteriota bacterium]